MKTLNEQDKKEVQAIAEVMMRMNDRNDRNASQSSTYGYLHAAVMALVKNNYNLELGDINWGGHATWADDVERAMRIAQSPGGEQWDKLIECVNLGNGYTNYALFRGAWYSVNTCGRWIQDVRWSASPAEVERLANL